MKLLKQLCEIHAPSGEEYTLTKFILKYIEENQKKWKQEILFGCSKEVVGGTIGLGLSKFKEIKCK